MRKLTSIALIVLLSVTAAAAADFQRSARGGGLGFSYFLLADDPSGALYNPSAVGFTKGWQTQMMYESASNYGYGYADEKPYYGQFGAAFYRPGLGSFALNTVQSGSMADQTNISTINHAVLSYGREFSPVLAAGGSVKYLKESAFGERSAFDLDIAGTFKANNGFIAAAAIENISRAQLSPEYLGVTEYLPRRSRIGAGYTFVSNQYEGAVLAAGQMEESGISEKQTTSLFSLGSEWWFMQQKTFTVGVRGGYTFGEAVQSDVKADYASPSAGLSLNYRVGFNDLRLDYSWQAYPFETADGSTQSNHYISLSFGWGGVPSYGRKQNQEAAVQKQTPKPAPKPAPKPVEVAIVEKPTPVVETPKVEPKAPIAETPQVELKAPVVDKDTDFDKSNYKVYNVEMEVNDISSMDLKRIVFYVRPQQVLKTTSWKLYIFKAKIKTWSQEEADRWAISVIEGKGVPPINIVWNGMGADGQYLPKGKYYYLLTAVDLKGENYATAWYNFRLE
jgi:hypothetical protein